MQRRSILLGLVACALIAAPRDAHAGLLSRSVDVLQLEPFVGEEIVRLGMADLTGLRTPGVFTTSGTTVGGTAGVRLGPIGLGFLLQHTSATDPQTGAIGDLAMTKAYGQFAISAQYGRFLIPVHFDFGYAYLSTPGVSVRGPGGKVGIGLDILVFKLWSVGADVDFDVQAYSHGGQIIGGYGGTFAFRIGLHIERGSGSGRSRARAIVGGHMDPRHVRIEGYFAREPEYTVDSLRQAVVHALAHVGVDGAWLRVAPVRAASNGGAPLGLVCAEVSAFGSDQFLAIEEALRSLASQGRTAFLLAYSGDEDRVIYDAYRDGAHLGGWEGVRREFPTTIEPEAGAAAADQGGGTAEQRAFGRIFRSHTGVEFDALLGSDAAWPILDHTARPGTEAFFLGRPLRVPSGTPKLLDLFRFRDRGGGQPGDRMAFLALDVEAATRLLKTAPAAAVAQLLGRLDEGAAFRLGPFTHAVQAAAAEAAALPAESPVGAGNPSLDLVELVHVVHHAGSTAGDTVDFYDHVLFPLLNLYEPADLPPLDPEELSALDDVGVLHAMAEVLPYSAPEGQLLESLADPELRPLAPAHAEDDEYQGSIYLVERTRLRTILDAFNGPRLMEQVERFLSAWFRAIEPDATDAAYGGWRRGRDHLDREDVERFATTLAELRSVIGLCDENGLELGLVFYEA